MLGALMVKEESDVGKGRDKAAGSQWGREFLVGQRLRGSDYYSTGMEELVKLLFENSNVGKCTEEGEWQKVGR